MARRDVDPADKVRLAARSASNNELAWWAVARAYLAVHLDVLHARHDVFLLCMVCSHRCAQGPFSCAIQVFALTLGTWNAPHRTDTDYERLRRNPRDCTGY